MPIVQSGTSTGKKVLWVVLILLLLLGGFLIWLRLSHGKPTPARKPPCRRPLPRVLLTAWSC